MVPDEEGQGPVGEVVCQLVGLVLLVHKIQSMRTIRQWKISEMSLPWRITDVEGQQADKNTSDGAATSKNTNTEDGQQRQLRPHVDLETPYGWNREQDK